MPLLSTLHSVVKLFQKLLRVVIGYGIGIFLYVVFVTPYFFIGEFLTLFIKPKKRWLVSEDQGDQQNFSAEMF